MRERERERERESLATDQNPIQKTEGRTNSHKQRDRQREPGEIPKRALSNLPGNNNLIFFSVKCSLLSQS